MKIPPEALKIKGIAYVKKYPYGELAKVSKNGKRHYATPMADRYLVSPLC